MNVVLLLFFGPIGLAGAVLKTSAVLLKYPTFEGFSFIFALAKKKYKIRVSVHFSIHTKKLINIEGE